MKFEEIDQNPELKNELLREMEEKARKTHDPIGAEIEVLKAHGIEFDEDALRAAAVEKMKLDEETLKNVAGGGYNNGATSGNYVSSSNASYSLWCVASYACHYIYKHPDEHNDSYIGKHEACFNDYSCLFLAQ